MKIIRSLVALLFSILMVALSVSCAHNTNVELSTVAEPTITPVTVTPAMPPSAAPSPTPTATPVLSATEAAFSEERTVELNRQIQDFLNYKGEYSKENIQKYLLPGLKKDEFYNLGLIKASESIIETQSWLFDYFEKDDDLLLIVGFDSEDGQRFVTILNIPIHVMKLSSVIQGISLVKLYGWNTHGGEIIGYSTDIKTIESYMIKNQPLWVSFYMLPASDEQAMSAGGEALVKANRYYTNGMSYTGNLVSLIDQNNTEFESILRSQNKEIQRFEELDVIYDMDNAKMPIVEGISFTN